MPKYFLDNYGGSADQLDYIYIYIIIKFFCLLRNTKISLKGHHFPCHSHSLILINYQESWFVQSYVRT